MFEPIRNKMREKVRNLEYVMTIHAEEEIENDVLSIFDVENAVLTGEVLERQKDSVTSEWKYLVGGKTLDDDDIIEPVCNFFIKQFSVISGGLHKF
jgi:hypothetical protein